MDRTITIKIESTGSDLLDGIRESNLQKIASKTDPETLQLLADLTEKPRIGEKLKNALKNPLFKNAINKA